ncbi:hypothetical protein CKO28_22780 [Rhodovibrio sodomensis]|uniref:SHOCT domain-containing protein n=1 Tax=Rhodovibrio sodomensis TaxID=1088 RepID=A0ABS1DK19_9PROT|nr:SHOCT domain-containing protein [Rhodovibrio sodomensis]MBK1670846.1 hypothetical protein [Rhodovibrio sodomensis]
MKENWLCRAAPTTIAAGVISATSTAMAQGNPAGRYDHMMWNGGWAHWIMGPFMMILFVGLLVFGVVAVIRWLGPPEQRARHAAGSSARAILEERFARGEIDEKEFSERKRALEE